ncbi:MAG: hypothetical protein ACUVUC_13330 [Thermoguttaceae bacterium]
MRSGWIGSAACWGLVVAGVLEVQVFAQKSLTRSPIPDAAAQEKALAAVRGLYGSELDKAKSIEQRSALAGKLLAAAPKAPRGSPERFVLLKLARDLALEAGSAELALQAGQDMADQFDLDVRQLKADLLAGLSKTVRQAAQKRALSLGAVAAAEQAASADDYQTAQQFLEIAHRAARDLRDATLTEHLAARQEAVAELARIYAVVAKSQAVLEQKPEDPAANLAMGTFQCLWKGDWQRGLPRLAASSDPVLRLLAQRELELADSAEAQLALADAWWDLALQNDGIARKQLQVHAADWYGRAIARLPDGLLKARAQKRLAEAKALAASLPLGAKGLGQTDALLSFQAPDTSGPSEPGKKGRINRKGRYESMLGIYLNSNRPVPCVNLSVPNGANMLTDEILGLLAGRAPSSQLRYLGVARFEVPRDGTYEIEQQFDKVWIDQRDMGFGRTKGSVFLHKGFHTIRVQESAPRLRAAYLRIRDKQSGQLVPVFNYGGEIEKFLRQSIGPWKVVEVSGWEPREVGVGARAPDSPSPAPAGRSGP